MLKLEDFKEVKIESNFIKNINGGAAGFTMEGRKMVDEVDDAGCTSDIGSDDWSKCDQCSPTPAGNGNGG